MAKKQVKVHKTAKRKAARRAVSAPVVAQQSRESAFPEQDFFRRIEDPLAFRIVLLEASKSSLNVLRGVYSMKETRQMKIDRLVPLQREVREIRLLIQKLEEMMPKYTRMSVSKSYPHLAKIPLKPQKTEVVEQPVVVQEEVVESPVVVAKTKTQLERLTDSIDQIEDRLKKMQGPGSAARQAKKSWSHEPAEKTEKKQDAWASSQEKKENPDLGTELGKTLDNIQKKLSNM
jgi:uncharacterized coiled-coil protein SlyX